MYLLCKYIGLVCGDIWLFYGYVRLFCGYIGLVCGDIGLFYAYAELLCAGVEFFGGNDPKMQTQSARSSFL